MEESVTPIHRPQRRHKGKMELFKEAYLPYLILLAAAILIVSFIIGAIVRDSHQTPAPESDTAQTAITQTTEGW